MTEIDKYSKYIEDLGFKFKDELTFKNGSDSINKLLFFPYKKSFIDLNKCERTAILEGEYVHQINSITLSFFFKSEEINFIRIDYKVRDNVNDYVIIKP